MNSEARGKRSGSIAFVAAIVVALVLIGAIVLLLKSGVFDLGGDAGNEVAPLVEQVDDQSSLTPAVGGEIESDNLGAEIFEETGGQVQGGNLTPSVVPTVNPLEGVYKNPFE